MDKIQKLEQRWYKYRIKKLGSLLLILSLFSLFIIGGYFIGLNFDKFEDVFSPKKNEHALLPMKVSFKEEEKNITAITPIVSVVPLTVPLIIDKRETLLLEPIIPILEIGRERIRKIKPIVKRSKKVLVKEVRAKPNMYLTAKELLKVEHHSRDTTHLKKIHLHSSSKNYIETMEKKFLKNKQPREALLLAEAFYRKKMYEKSEEWALRANEIDATLDESWIIFAQSKAKMAKKDEAIRILVAYYNKTKSTKVKRAIEKIQTGR
jgi:hypothetical protein